MTFHTLPTSVLMLWLSGMAFLQPQIQKPKATADQHSPGAGARESAGKAPASEDQSAREIILIGELHGTQETPRLFSNLVMVAAGEKSRRLAAGLELPIQLQPLIDQAVKNNTSVDSLRKQLLADPAWQKINDGRSSQAMLDLISDMLKLAESGKLSLFFFDTEVNERDDTMAQLIGQRVRGQRYEMTFILTGNIHANRAAHHPLKKQVVPMGRRLEEQGFTVRSYDVGFSEGETWMCSPTECGIHHLKGWHTVADSAATDQQGYDGILFAGPIHASPPAHDPPPLKPGQ